LNLHLRIFLLVLISFLGIPISNSVQRTINIDPNYQWNLLEVGIEDAWRYTTGSPDIVIALVDSGVNLDHPNLVDKLWINPREIANNGVDDDGNGYVDDINGWDFRDNDNNPSPGHHHGTFVAGLLVGKKIGIAPKVKLMVLRFLNDDNKFEENDWGMFVDVVDYARENGAHIIHLSIQTYGVPPSSFHSAIKQAHESGKVIVSAAGNNVDEVSYPGNYSEVIAVSATTKTREIAEFSTSGDQNELCAPGENVYSIIPNYTGLIRGNGTSFAAPHVSGVIALMLSLNQSLSVGLIRQILHNTCIDLGEEGKDPIFGYGLLNASAAVRTVYNRYYNGGSSQKTGNGDNLRNSVIIFVLYLIIVKRKSMKDKQKRSDS
jgi:subtilisin family serine protease